MEIFQKNHVDGILFVGCKKSIIFETPKDFSAYSTKKNSLALERGPELGVDICQQQLRFITWA